MRRPAAGSRGGGAAPAVLLVLAVLALALAGFGGATVLERRERTLVTSGTVDGLAVSLGRARWIENQMDHGGTFGMPSVMMPDLPDHATHQRLTVDLELVNRSGEPRRIAAADFRLETDRGLVLPATGGYGAERALAPGHGVIDALSFDFPLDHDAAELRLVWRERGRQVHMPVPPLPDHWHLDTIVGFEWPESFAALGRVGRPAKGLQLYAEKYGCAACHGQPENPGTQTVGPTLAGFARSAAERLGGDPVEQFAYESLLRPNDHIAPECGPGGEPCATPSAMPAYGDLLTREDMAHLVAYLMAQNGNDA